ncbi:TrbC/VirB2 family protein [Streptococcus agalactiae]|uniref:TrbC/VirB2 family protein n=1 Tax=Streptococcus agalactiae TaxID=1311 RepID=UPI0022EAE76E|nr:TrbC/VirB2 family protein [Streptococcus agalactiae]HEM9549198.1 TrbC/VirB2 family protein [Streptococcus agalactiae]HEM9551179.1 TrbC/VirB2 family protein [Streptococcus agalactiae]HEM9553160.1 TrbC/VirB2 family protein [Streptococcus agalactiae]HEM9567088.1 TrbC/VirB2 family protein [Streptococcus agalactiae]HEM9606120.1 TrbC/VirB2 family protein [Streptococcus agalactiae]
MKSKLTNFIDKVKTKGKGYLLSLSLFLSGIMTNTAYADDPFAKTDALAQQGISKVQGIGIVTLGLAVVITGLVYGFGGREVKAAIKKHWVAIAVSIIAVSAGPSIVEWGFNFVKG